MTGGSVARRPASWAAAVLAAGSVMLLGVAVTGQQSVSPRRVAAEPADADPPVTSPAADSAVPTRSQPLRIEIPAIGVSSPLVELGLDTGGALQVPRDFELAGWYQLGPTPGERGPAVIAGHVDSAQDGPAVFFRLSELAPGDRVEVPRADGQTAVFALTRIEQYPKDSFPTIEVYGDTAGAALRLITCGGSFDEDTGHYRDNVVAYADLVDVRRPS